MYCVFITCHFSVTRYCLCVLHLHYWTNGYTDGWFIKLNNDCNDCCTLFAQLMLWWPRTRSAHFNMMPFINVPLFFASLFIIQSRCDSVDNTLFAVTMSRWAATLSIPGNNRHHRHGSSGHIRGRSAARASRRLATYSHPCARIERVQMPAVSRRSSRVGRQAAGARLFAQGQCVVLCYIFFINCLFLFQYFFFLLSCTIN